MSSAWSGVRGPEALMSRLILAVLVAVLSGDVLAQNRPLPIIDMHLHANRADDNGPPPTYLCPGFEGAGHDPRQPWADVFTATLSKPACANPVVGAETDEALMKTTLEILERRNIIGVASGPLIDRWHKAGGDRIIPSAAFGFGPGTPSAATLRDWFAAKRFLDRKSVV